MKIEKSLIIVNKWIDVILRLLFTIYLGCIYGMPIFSFKFFYAVFCTILLWGSFIISSVDCGEQ